MTSIFAAMPVPDRSGTETPCSFVSEASFQSYTPTLARTPVPQGLSPRPASPAGSKPQLLPGFVYDENVPPCMNPRPAPPMRQSSRLSVPRSPDAESVNSRARASSTVSGHSATTWWSAAASLKGSLDREEREQPWTIRKVDSGVAMEGVSERRESTSSGYSSNASMKSHETKIRRPMSSETVIPRPRTSRRSSMRTTSSGTTRSRPSTAQATRSSTTDSGLSTATSSATLRPGKAALPRSRCSPPMSPTSTQGYWETPETTRRRQRRAEIGASLSQKYPNDRVHGEFLPFRSEFSHSADSLSPVQFLRSEENVSAPMPAAVRRRNTCPGPDMSNATNWDAGMMTTPAEIEEYPSSLLAPTTVQWKNVESLRAEYAAVDRKKRSLWGWIRRRVLCGAGVLGCAGRKEFWEEGDTDAGSVRRYRLDLPESREQGKMVAPTPRRVRSMDSAHAVVVDKTKQPIEQAKGDSTAMDQRSIDRRSLDRRSTIGVFDGRGVVRPAPVAIATATPEPTPKGSVAHEQGEVGN